MSNILEHISVNSDRKLREVSDQAFQSGYNAGMREGYSSRVKDEADACQLLPFWSAVTMCRSGMVDLEFGPRKFLELTPDEARELADALSEAADEIPETIDYDAERKAAIEEAM